MGLDAFKKLVAADATCVRQVPPRPTSIGRINGVGAGHSKTREGGKVGGKKQPCPPEDANCSCGYTLVRFTTFWKDGGQKKGSEAADAAIGETPWNSSAVGAQRSSGGGGGEDQRFSSSADTGDGVGGGFSLAERMGGAP
eukprot:CAMPEP_0184403260 /NCGR_PEP_ID=MMETSP0007-20130409/85312_1 /TAXON_ID=97485 /ORGANISM="Prymnesium parvum, Strain Texoma1" /LENGTH=139 /DNA_ID=CAMNT_0026759349 /DNA_START=1120 /DNA_END=1539 /DNA_ORIENTATION=+